MNDAETQSKMKTVKTRPDKQLKWFAIIIDCWQTER